MSRWIAKRLAKEFAPMIKLDFRTIGALSKAFYKKYGDEALPIIAEVMGGYGAESAKMAQNRLKGKGMKMVGELFGMYEMLDIFKTMEIIELSDDVMHMKSSPCPWGLEGATRDLCEIIDKTMWKAVVSTLLGQESEVKILRTVATGDENCEVICSIKK
jgi:hypothetical protein